MEYERLQEIYAHEEYYWGTDHNDLAELAVEFAPERDDLSAIDVGAGEGRDSVYMAEQGLDVLAVDVAPNGLEKAQRLADERGVEIGTEPADVNDLELARPVDVVYAIGSVQYLRPENRSVQFDHFKDQTRPGGVHAMFAFVDRDDVPTAPDWGENEHFYDRTELQEYYRDWERLYRDEFVFDDDSGGEPHQHAAVEVVYRKPDAEV